MFPCVEGDTRYRVRIAKSERTWDEHLEVLAEHSTNGHGFSMSGKVGN